MLQIRNVCKTFNKGTPNQKQALGDFSLHLKSGDFVTVIGGNGAGKSTLLNTISGLFWVDGGQILLDGEDITYQKQHRRSRHMGRLFQDPLMGSAPNMTIEENLSLAYLRSRQNRRFSFGPRKEDLQLYREKLALLNLGLEDRLHTKMGLLSGGQRQAVTLLMATIVTPKLLMLDEHTAALDPATADKVLELTRSIVAENKITTLMVTHNIGSALELGNRTIMLDNGNLVLELEGEARREMTVEKLLKKFKEKSNKELDNDRMLLN
ncbi:ATP-binding cassette domain-containing protein [Oscillospiraceae bacterium MB08-C2-2]|nr:ATP-binding cassette domain-containing protein [Oscillospiraceae bacterium MB08-C2-2]